MNWTVDPGTLHYYKTDPETGRKDAKEMRFNKIAFVPGFVLIEEATDGIVRGRPARRVTGIEFDKKG